MPRSDVKPEAELRRQELMQRPRDYTPAAGAPSGGKILRTVDIEKATHFTFAGGYAPILKPGGRRAVAPPSRPGTAAECLGGGDRDIHGLLREAPAEPSPAKPQHQPTAVGKLMGEPDPTAAPDLHFTLIGSIPQSRPQGGRRPHAAAASSVGALLQPDPTAGAKPDSHFTLHNGVAIGRQHGGRRHIDGAHVTSVGRALREEIGGAPRKVEALRWPPARAAPRRPPPPRRRAGGRAARRRAAAAAPAPAEASLQRPRTAGLERGSSRTVLEAPQPLEVLRPRNDIRPMLPARGS